MGLDMYLCPDDPKVHNIESFEWKEEYVYWRKANMVHGYFCNVGSELEPQVLYRITREEVIDLLCRCIDILYKNKSPEDLLPVCQGFFFGSYEYDEFYRYHLVDTVKLLIELLEEHPDKTFLYYASW